MGRLLQMSEHIEAVKDHSNDQVDREVEQIEDIISKGEKWLAENDETHDKFDACFLKLQNLLRRRAALYLRECEPREVGLF